MCPPELYVNTLSPTVMYLEMTFQRWLALEGGAWCFWGLGGPRAVWSLGIPFPTAGAVAFWVLQPPGLVHAGCRERRGFLVLHEFCMGGRFFSLPLTFLPTRPGQSSGTPLSVSELALSAAPRSSGVGLADCNCLGFSTLSPSLRGTVGLFMGSFYKLKIFVGTLFPRF